MNEIEQLAVMVSIFLSCDLDIDIPEIVYLRNHEEGVHGKVLDSMPGVIFLDIPQIEKDYKTDLAINLAIVKTLCHEARHLWQDKNNWSYDWDVPYELRQSEIDAYNYAEYMHIEIINELFKEIA